jgi:glycosyltransferase involved in cell wall biosynthesis
MSKKMLGLNIIVGKGEEKELERCLKSCIQGDLFDELVVTQTFEDDAVRSVIEKYQARREFFAWVKDFAAARNYSFSKSTTRYIMWLDSDDEIKSEEFKKLQELKPKLYNYDIVLVDYVYNHDEKDNPMLVLPRERIVKNCDQIKWHDPIHEYMNMDVPPERVCKTKIRVDHYRTKPYDPNRNLDALRLAYKDGQCSPRLKFYFGKELSDCGYWDEAIKVLEPYLEEAADFRDNMTVACIRLSKYYYENKNYSAAKTYAMKGIRFNSIYAENYVTVGMVFEIENDPNSAASYYKEALTKTLEGGMSQIVDFYGFIPAAKLALLYFAKKDYEETLKYCDLALKHKSDNVQMMELRKTVSIELERSKRGRTIREEDEAKLVGVLESLNFKMEIQKNNQDFADIRVSRVKVLEVVWLIPGLDLDNPSTRIRRYNVSNKMEQLGVSSRIITGYYGKNVYELRNEIGSATVVVFTQYSQSELELMRHLRPLGIKVVFDHCEALFGYPFENECMAESDMIACCSTKLEELTKERGFSRTAVLKDSFEERTPNVPVVYENRHLKPKAVYMGMGGNSFLVNEWLKSTIESAGYELVVITEWDNATKKWNKDTWPDDMAACDVVLCPQRVEVQPAKSSVKATTAMALGMPVIASPLQAYKEIIVDGKNGFICDTKEQWFEALFKLKDASLRREIGTAAVQSVGEYSLEAIARKWADTLTLLINDKIKFPEPVKVEHIKERQIVDVIIANYGNVEYLKLCVNSILMNTLYPFHIIISDAGSDAQTWEYLRTLKGMTVLGEPGKRVSFSEACNAGIRESKSRFFVILNSDVIVSKCWLTNLVDKMESVNRLAACGVLSNCDRGWLFDSPNVPDSPKYPMRLNKQAIELVPGMKIDTIKPYVEDLYDFMRESNETNKGKFVPQQWVAAYATIFAKCAIDEVGLFDPLYKNGCEDWDLCQRLSRFGYAIGQAIDSFVFHFGGVSRGAYESENRDSYKKEDVENHVKMRRKWDKERIAIYTGPAWEPWNKQKVDEGMAGSETWASYLAREFVKKGYRTTVYNDLLTEDKSKSVLDPVQDDQGREVGEVIYRHYPHLVEDIKYDVVDYFISSRTLDPFHHNVHSLRNYAMVHDIWLSPDPALDIMSWRMQGYACLSEWHKEFLKSHHKIPDDKFFMTANGVDHTLYADVDEYEKKNQAVYSSSPDRGLYQLLLMLPEIRKAVPDFKVVIAYGFFNWESSVKARNDVQSMALIKAIKDLMDQPGVDYRDRVNKRTLAVLQKESKVFLYPSWFTETFCITAVENGFAKNALLSTDLAGLSTTVGGAGILLPPRNLNRDLDYPGEYKYRFIEEAIRLLKDEEYRVRWANRATEKMKQYTWENVANGWLGLFKK